MVIYMDYRLGNSKYINALGETEVLTCPKCKKEVKLSVFSNFNTRAVAKLPFLKAGYIYFLVCPECSAIYGVDESNGTAFKKGAEFAIMQGDLKEPEEYKV